MKFFVLVLSALVSFNIYGMDDSSSTASGVSVTSFPTMEQLKAEGATLQYAVPNVGFFVIDTSNNSVQLEATFQQPVGKDNLTVRLVSSNPADMQKQITLSTLVSALRVGESSQHYAAGPVAGLEETFKGVALNLGLQNNTAETGLPRFWVEVYKESTKNWLPIGFARLGNGSKDRLKDAGVPEAMAKNEALKALLAAGYPEPGVGGFAEPAALIHTNYHGKGIGAAFTQLMLQVVLPVYREMGVAFGVIPQGADKKDFTPLNWIFSTASADNPMSQGLIAKIPGVIKLGEFSSVHGAAKKQYLLMPVFSGNVECTKQVNGTGEGAKPTYVVQKKALPTHTE